MGANKVDILFVVDASDSMSPCFQKLRDNLRRFIQPLNQASFEIRYGLLAYNAGADGRNAIYEHTFIGGNDPSLVKGLYSPQVNTDKYFTSDANKFLTALESVRTQGDENTLLALDTAADFPFRTPDESRRVIALFTNEKLEDGILENEPLAKFPQVLQKIAKRKISLYAYLPTSDSAALLTRLPKTFVKSVGEGADCWDHIDFGQILEQMGKSISQSSLQMTREPDYQKAVYGQNTWDSNSFVGAGDARREKILATGESAKLNMSKPLEWIHVKLFWKQQVDLDLHAIWSFRGENYHVFFHHKREQDVVLDVDEGVGERGGAIGGYKEENITISTLNRIEKMLIATKNYTGSGCFADYDGKVVVETSNGDNITVPLTSQSRDVWCVIAAIDNSDQRAPEVKNLNRTSRNDPAVEEFI
ncbi:MAG: VWA domain-containing protein [Lentisphaerae bacterium]|nr:VWA domain-containing protein [Lentisphaerota bacterium]